MFQRCLAAEGDDGQATLLPLACQPSEGVPQAAQEIKVLADPAGVRNSEAHHAENV